jgi:hypothetical protein
MLINASRGRYYSQFDMQYERCRNCEQMGHHFRNCPLDQVIRCHFCMQNHKREQCELDYCFLCSKAGHRASACPHRNERTCRRCYKRGHYEADCAMLLNFRSVNQRSFEHLKVSQDTIKCLNCGQNGHLQCYLKGSQVASQIVKDNLYNRESMRLSAIEMNLGDLIDDEDVHSKVVMSKNQRRRKLNELIEIDEEDNTVEAFNQYAHREKEYKSQLVKRRPEKDFGRRSQDQRGGYHDRNQRGHRNQHGYPPRGRGGHRNHF